MLNMGFAEDVETILADTPDDKHVALFSATMPAQIRRISKKYLEDPVEITVKNKTSTVSSITQRYLIVLLPAEGRRPHAHPRGRELRGHDRLRPHQERDRDPRREAPGPRLLRDGHQRRRRPGAARAHGQPAEVRQARHPRRHRRRGPWPRRRAHQPRRQLRHPHRHRVLRPPHRPYGPRGSQRRLDRLRHPARAPPAPRDREGHPPAAHADAAADGRRRQRHPADPLRRRDHPGASAARAHRLLPRRGRPLRQRARRARGRRGRRARRGDARRRSRCCSSPSPSARTRAFDERPTHGGKPERRPARSRAAASRWRPTGSRSASGTRSSRARSSAPWPTRAVSRAATSATSRSGPTSRSSSCPPTCPPARSTGSRPPGSPAS